MTQLAFERLHGRVPNSYEATTTAGFRHGRTETLRSVTPEARALCSHLLNKPLHSATGSAASDQSDPNGRKLLEDAKAAHSKLTKEALTGTRLFTC